MTPTGRPSLTTSTTGTAQQGDLTGQSPILLVSVCRFIKNPIPMTSMILSPRCNNQICAIREVFVKRNSLTFPLKRRENIGNTSRTACSVQHDLKNYTQKPFSESQIDTTRTTETFKGLFLVEVPVHHSITMTIY